MTGHVSQQRGQCQEGCERRDLPLPLLEAATFPTAMEICPAPACFSVDSFIRDCFLTSLQVGSARAEATELRKLRDSLDAALAAAREQLAASQAQVSFQIEVRRARILISLVCLTGAVGQGREAQARGKTGAGILQVGGANLS